MKFRFRAFAMAVSAASLFYAQVAFSQDATGAENAGENSANTTAVIHTSQGDITLELLEEQAPVTVENFVTYAQDGFYDGTIFHRVISHFMIQGGGLTPELQPKPTRDPIVNESANGISNTRGTVAMARTANPDSATSQFFINVQDNPNLDQGPTSAGYAVFARVTDGMEVVDEIRFMETGSQPPYHDVPVEPVIIESVEIITSD